MDLRKFSRILYSSAASLELTEQTIPTTILDLSLRGALVEKPQGIEIAVGTHLDLKFQLGESDLVLMMAMQVAHSHQHTLGLRCERIDIDSAAHLKRLIELNLGDADLLSRELSELSN